MKGPHLSKRLLLSVLSVSYTQHDVREFADLCYALALPLIRKRIGLGKLNLSIMGMKETDVVQDTLAELFCRDERGNFTELQTFFKNCVQDLDNLSEQELVFELWRLISGTVNNNVVRLYAEVDPTLARIIRNTKIAVEKTGLLKEVKRFGETYLIPCDSDPAFHLMPMDPDFLELWFSRIVNLQDNTLEMVRKLHATLMQQESHQRAVPLVAAALLFKKVFTLDSKSSEDVAVNEATEALAQEDLLKAVEKVSQEVYAEMYPRYVDKGKKESGVLEKYCFVIKDMLLSSRHDGHAGDATLFDHLCAHIEGLTKEEYKREHQTTLEYLVKIAKSRMRQELQRQ